MKINGITLESIEVKGEDITIKYSVGVFTFYVKFDDEDKLEFKQFLQKASGPGIFKYFNKTLELVKTFWSPSEEPTRRINP